MLKLRLLAIQALSTREKILWIGMYVVWLGIVS